MSKTFFLTSTVYHKKFRDRLDAAIESSSIVVVIGFDRKDELRTGERRSTKVCYSLVSTPAKVSLLRRIHLLILLIYRIIIARLWYGRPDTVLANSADLMILASIFFHSANRRVYDLADINPIQYGSSPFSRAFRQLESSLLKRRWEIVVTSPWFYWEYIRPVLKLNSACYLIENKLIGRRKALKPHYRLIKNRGKFVIGWSGLLRCNRSFEILLDLCESHNDNIELIIIGDTTKIRLDLINKARLLCNVQISGPYIEEEIGDRLADIDLLWACDLSDGINSQCLLPNRLYQAVFYGKPLISQADSAIAKVVGHFGLGLILQECTAKSLASQLLDITQMQYDSWLSNCIPLREKTLRGGEWKNFLTNSVNSISRRIPHNEDVAVVFHAYEA